MASISFIIFVSLLGLSSVYSNIADFDCFERTDSGPGRAYIEAYSWQARNKTCTKFIYGGLSGNRNRFTTYDECYQSCRDAVLRKQTTFNPARRYSVVNRLYKTFQIASNFEQVDDGYFKIIVQPNGQVLSVNTKDITGSIDLQESNNDIKQHWDIIPTGEKSFYRIKTRSKAAGSIDFLFLHVAANDTVHVNVGRRDQTDLGQQWRFV